MRILSEEAISKARIKSERGDAKATMSLGENSLAQGLRDEAKHFYKIAAEQGSSVAANMLGVLYAEDGANEEAIEWLKIACLAGNKLACAHLSISYLGGNLGLDVDRQKAEKYGRLGDMKPEK